MKLRIATTTLALAAALATPAYAGGQGGGAKPYQPPVTTAVLAADLYGSVATTVESVFVPGTIDDGDVSVAVDQAGVNSPIVLLSIVLDPAFSLDPTLIPDLLVTGECTGDPTVDVTAQGFTVRGLSCLDGSDEGSNTTFTVTLGGLFGTTTATAWGDSSMSVQYRTNGTRKIKAQTWVMTDPLALTFGEYLIG